MANNKIDRIERDILKTREKISEYQNRLRALEAQKPKICKSYSLCGLCT